MNAGFLCILVTHKEINDSHVMFIDVLLKTFFSVFQFCDEYIFKMFKLICDTICKCDMYFM